MKIRITLAALFSLVVLFSFGQGVKFTRDMAPAEGWVKAPEKPYREEICINGYWEFQPVKVPGNWKRDLGVPPELTMPEDSKWEKVKIKIPSPWNANSILHDKTGGGMDSRTYPSYPESWNTAKMGWLRKKVTIPESWKGKTISLRLQAVAGDCRIMVNNKEIAQQFENALPNEYDIAEAIEWGKENEILLGIRDAKLNNLKGKYGAITYPTGSFWLMDAIGVWQDVFVLAKPNVHITDIFFQPQVKQDVLLVDVELVNNSSKKQEVQVQLPIYEWINKTDLSKQNMLMAPEISWSLGEEAMKLSSAKVVLEPNQKKNITLKADVKGRLKKWELWTRGNPNLYAGVAQLQTGKNTIDKYYQRFGWRDIKIENGHVMLNGRREQLMHEGWHFTGIPTLTRRYAWAWYTIAKDAHVNLVRPHAMPYPSFFYDMADEMGMLLMDESGIFGSHVGFNYESDLFWERNQKHIESLVRRDRNHPSVMGWSVSNEVRCVLVWQAKNDPDFQQKIYDKIFDLTKIAKRLDPTRDWVQSDGDKDLDGRLGVYTIHTGGAYSDVIPKDKPWGVTEGGSSYYGKAGYYEPFVGDRTYRSFNDRMDGLAIEDYNLIRTLRKDSADVLNVWNLVWHGLKPLPLGLKNPAAKVLKLTDGVFFEPYVEGKPGIQPERIAPYSTTLNPGYDPTLPLLNPYPLYTAMQSAMAPNGAQACQWDKRDKQMNEVKSPKISNPVDQVSFLGDRESRTFTNLKSIGVPLVEADKVNKFLIINVSNIDEKTIVDVKKSADKVIGNGGTVFLVGLSTEKAALANQILPTGVQCVPDKASSLVPNLNDPRTASISYKELYFAEDAVNKTICNYTLKGDFIDKGNTLLFRNNTEWLRWITGGEYSKTISVYRSELENKQTPVLVELKQGKGNYLVSTIELESISANHVNMYIKLFKNIGLKLNPKQDLTVSAFSGKVLVRALSLGRFGSDDLATTMSTKYISEETVKPKQNSQEAGMLWKMVTNEGEDQFIFKKMAQAGPETVFATYFGYWVYSPVDLSDLLNSGPDLPQVTLQILVNSDAKVLMNGKPLKVTKADKVGVNKKIIINSIPLKQGWNQFLIKAVSDSFVQPNQGSIRVTMESNIKAFDEQLKTAIEN